MFTKLHLLFDYEDTATVHEVSKLIKQEKLELRLYTFQNTISSISNNLILGLYAWNT